VDCKINICRIDGTRSSRLIKKNTRLLHFSTECMLFRAEKLKLNLAAVSDKMYFWVIFHKVTGLTFFTGNYTEKVKIF